MNKTVLMICDDTRIDRRILQEAETLIAQGYDVTLLSHSHPDLPAVEHHGGLTIYRIAPYSEKMEQLVKIPFSTFAVMDDVPAPAMSFTQASAAFDSILKATFPTKGLGYMPEHYAKYGKLRRHLSWALVWPPHRLFILSKLMPWLPRALRTLLYLPTLALTPRPAAIRFHWHKLSTKIREKARHNSLSSKGEQLEQVVAGLRFTDLSRWEIACFLHGAALRPDIAHVHDLPQLRTGAFLSRLLGIPLVYDAHEMYPAISTLGKSQQSIYKEIEHRFIQLADAVITVNPFIGDLMRQAYGIPAPTIIQNAVSLPENYNPAEEHATLRTHLKLGAEARIILFQGWISSQRADFDDLVKALKYVPETIHLAFLGFGDGVSFILEQARKSGMAKRVHYIEAVPQDELPHWVSSADAGIIPYKPIDDNHRYCSPNKLYEFMAARLPIIANDLPFLRRIVSEHGVGVVGTLDSPEGYAAAIREIFDPGLGGTKRFAAAYDALTEPFFLWQSQEKMLLGVYAGLPAKKKTSNACPIAHSVHSEQPLRILHGFYNIAGIPSVMAGSERELGLNSLAACYDTGTFGYRPDIPLSLPVTVKDFSSRFSELADSADVFVFHFGSSFGEETLTDIPLLKRLGKKIIFYFHGCDVLNREKTMARYAVSACANCTPPLCNPNRDLALGMAALYADSVWVSTPNLLEFVPHAELFPQPLDVRKHAFRPASAAAHPGPMKILHSPSAPKLKGTAHVRKAVRQLKEEGVPVELILLQGISHDQLMAELAKADLAVDQLLFGAYGTFAVELMAVGVPVICHIREDLKPLYPASLPIISATPNSLADTIKNLVRERSTWDDVSGRGREYVERYHDTAVIAKRAREIYTGL